MATQDRYGLALTTSPLAASAYNEGVGALLRVQDGALLGISQSIAHDPTFALGHAGLALLGHEFGAPVDVSARVAAATRHAARGSERERSHVHAVAAHIAGDSAPLIAHLQTYPRDAVLLAVAVPTIAFAGVTNVPEESWAIVERSIPAYGDDWWFSGLLAFIRQEQCRFDESMSLARRSMEEEPASGHAVHARAHVHYETGDHVAGRDWLDSWMVGPGRTTDNLAHFSWHAALHELSLGDLAAVRSRYGRELAPPVVVGCRALVDSCSLLWRWAITPDAQDVPSVDEVVDSIESRLLDEPPTPFMALHSAVTLCAQGDSARLRHLESWSLRHPDPVYGEVVSPLCRALEALADGEPSVASDRLSALRTDVIRLGGSDAQREVVDDTLIAALLAAGRHDEAIPLIDERLDRRSSPRDEAFKHKAAAALAAR